MLDQEIRSKIKNIKIHTKRIMQSALSGDYLSAFKGTGLEFEQIREYTPGDDIRSIDWNSSAKMNKIMVKQFREERERTVILALDISGSMLFGSGKEQKKEILEQLAATLAFIASENKDNVGALFFSDTIEQWIPPSKGNVHIGKIIETIFSIKPKDIKTDFDSALKFLISLKKRGSVIFMLSDWITSSPDYQKLLRIAACEYDFVGMRIIDPCEQNLPDIGFLDMIDSEDSGQEKTFLINTRKSPVNLFLEKRLFEQKKLFEKYKIDLLDLHTNRPFISPLVRFFHQRIRRQI